MLPRMLDRARIASIARKNRRTIVTKSAAALLSATLISIAPQSYAVDGSWTQTAAANQLWTTSTNWLNGTIADGVGGNAVFNVNLIADQNVQLGAGGRTIGNVYFRDTTLAAPDGGFGLGIAGDGALTMDVASGRALISISALAASKKVATGAPIVNTDGILKIGSGQLSIRSNSPGFTGDYVAAGGLTDTRSLLSGISALQVTGGAQFQFDFTTATPVSDLVNVAAPLTLGGTVSAPPVDIPPALPPNFNAQITGNSTLTVTGKAATTNSQTFASTSLKAGFHTVNVANGGAGASATLNLGPISRDAGATINFAPSGVGTSTITTPTINGAGSILGGWATVSGTTWAVSAGDGINPGAITGLATFATDTWSAGSNTDVVTSLASVSGDTNSVRFNTLAANTVTLTGPSAIASGGILNTITVGANASQITGGSLTSGTNELVIHQNNSTAGGTLTIASQITNNTGTVAVTKQGAGIAIIAGTLENTFTGTTTVESGVLQFGKTAGVNAVGGDVMITGSGVLHLLAAEQIPNTATIFFTGSSADSVPTQTGQETVANVVVNATSLPVASAGQFIMRNNFTVTGTATVANGIFAVASSNNATVNAINMTTPNAIIRIAGSGGASTLNVGAGGITSAGGDIQVKFNANNQDGKLVLGGNFTATGNVTITNAGYTGVNANYIDLTATRTFDIATGTTTTVQPDIVGAGGLTKTGNGTLTLTNLSNTTYIGATAINAGTLQVNGTITGTAKVDIGNTATLAGTGTIAPVSGGDVNLLLGGILAPGASTGTLIVNLAGGGELDLTAGIAPSASGALRFELGAVAASDKVALTGGALNLGTGLLDFGDFSFSTLAGFDTAGTYTLFDGATPIVGTLGATNSGLINGQMFQLQFADSNNDLVLTAVPEPGAVVLSLGALGMLALRRRRERGV